MDDRGGAVLKSIRVGDAVPLKAEKLNKLSSNFDTSPFKFFQNTGSEVTVRDDVRVEFKRNTAFVNKYKEPDESSPVERSVGDGGDHVDGDVEENGDLEERPKPEQTTVPKRRLCH